MHVWTGPSKQMYLSYFTNKLFLNKAEYTTVCLTSYTTEGNLVCSPSFWLLHSWTHGKCDCLYKTRPSNFVMDVGGIHEVTNISKNLQMVVLG